MSNIVKNLTQMGKRTHTGRFIGSLVADFHRNMMKGGIFYISKNFRQTKWSIKANI